ncbi:uncharacterized protein BKA78DRAFT_29504 [Phyllosticta capitalensis]|uniref:uncharacterized protein n=1 Tax=Phyllosticta capitalensis TaxID=121624 RepID=UPI0031317235
MLGEFPFFFGDGDAMCHANESTINVAYDLGWDHWIGGIFFFFFWIGLDWIGRLGTRGVAFVAGLARSTRLRLLPCCQLCLIFWGAIFGVRVVHLGGLVESNLTI